MAFLQNKNILITGLLSSRSIAYGIAIVGGMILSQLLTLYTTPVVYLYLDRFRLWCARKRVRAVA